MLRNCCAKKANVPPENCLFIGDSLKKDVLGARNAGMQALWYCPEDAKRDQHPEIPAIAHFDQLRKMLAEE